LTQKVKAPEERRKEFISTAQNLFFTKGYARTSVNDIINAVGVSKGAFYHYFSSKGALLEAVVKALNIQFLEAIRTIVVDGSLDAITKWNQLMQVGGNWKIEQKEELQSISRILRMDENLPLGDQLRTERAKLFSLECSPVIVQGIQEGVFDTGFPEETTEYAYSIMTIASDAFFEILLNLDIYQYPLTLARNKLTAAQTAVERLLGTPPNSIWFINEKTLVAWFAD